MMSLLLKRTRVFFKPVLLEDGNYDIVVKMAKWLQLTLKTIWVPVVTRSVFLSYPLY